VNLQNYELRIRGLKEAPGKIKAAAFMHTLGALIKTAERATRLLATGAGTGRGSRIGTQLKGDSAFEEVPSVASQEPHGSFPQYDTKFQAFDPIELAGAWPGNEPLEDLLAQLD